MKSDFAVNDVSKKNCRVRVTFDNGYSVERFRKHKDMGNGIKVYKDGQYLSELERGSTRDAQKALESVLGISFETFTKAVVLGDNAAMNFLMSDSKRRRETIEELLDMDVFDLFLAETRERKKALQTKAEQEALREESVQRDAQARAAEKQRCIEGRGQILQQLKEAEEEASEIAAKIKEWEKSDAELKKQESHWVSRRNEQRVIDKWAVYQSHIRSQEMANEVLSTLHQQLAEKQALQQELQGLWEKEPVIRTISKTIEDLRNVQGVEHQTEIARKEQHVTELDSQHQKMNELLSQGKCPTCQQSVTSTKIKAPVDELKTLRTKAVAELNSATAKRKASEALLLKSEKELETHLGGLTLQAYNEKLAQKTGVDAQVQQLLESVQRQQERITASPDPELAIKDLNMPLSSIKSIVQSAQSANSSSTNDPAEARASHQSQYSFLTEEKFRLQAEITRLKVL